MTRRCPAMSQTSDAEMLVVIGGANIDEEVRMITKSLKQMKIQTQKLLSMQW